MYETGKKKGTIRFQWDALNGTHTVSVAGDFNQWQPVSLRRQRGRFVAVLPVPGEGRYEYKFLVNGQWRLDPDNVSQTANPYGTLNSVAVLR